MKMTYLECVGLDAGMHVAKCCGELDMGKTLDLICWWSLSTGEQVGCLNIKTKFI